ncbi:MAG: hypothetical protein L6Q57_04080 [Alphaproteobacteria bacterium]|nr:hypothetical protein [Alphaproteobacteria bacterium]
MDFSTHDDFDIQALVDYELSYESEKSVRQYVEANPGAKKRYEELRRQKMLLQAWWQQSSAQASQSKYLLIYPACEQNGSSVYSTVIH